MKQIGSPEPFRAWRRPWFWPAVVMGITLADSATRALCGFSAFEEIATNAILNVYSLCLPKAVGRHITGSVSLTLLLMPSLMLLLLTFVVSTHGKRVHAPSAEAEQWELARQLVVSARLIALLWVAVSGVQWWAMLHGWSNIWSALPWVAYLPLALLVWRAVRGPRKRRPKPGETAESANE